MKRTLITFILLASFAFSGLIQEGLYPDCSYVIVTEDGWRIHKNQAGRILSMIPKSKHNDEVGKYSFDTFGNLVPFIECAPLQKMINNTTQKIEEKENSNTEIEIEVKIDLMKNLSFSVHGGGMMAYGDNIDELDIGAQGGVDIKLNNYTLSIMGGINSGTDVETLDGASIGYSVDLTQTGIFAGYTFNFGKFYAIPSIGMINRSTKTTINSITIDGDTFECTGSDCVGEDDYSDTGVKVEVGMNFGKISIYGGGTYTTTFLEKDQTATFYMAGLKYNF